MRTQHDAIQHEEYYSNRSRRIQSWISTKTIPFASKASVLSSRPSPTFAIEDMRCTLEHHANPRSPTPLASHDTTPRALYGDSISISITILALDKDSWYLWDISAHGFCHSRTTLISPTRAKGGRERGAQESQILRAPGYVGDSLVHCDATPQQGLFIAHFRPFLWVEWWGEGRKCHALVFFSHNLSIVEEMTRGEKLLARCHTVPTSRLRFDRFLFYSDVWCFGSSCVTPPSQLQRHCVEELGHRDGSHGLRDYYEMSSFALFESFHYRRK